MSIVRPALTTCLRIAFVSLMAAMLLASGITSRETASAQTPIDYDSDDDGLIEINT